MEIKSQVPEESSKKYRGIQLIPHHNRETFVLSNFIQVWAVLLVSLGVAPFLFTKQVAIFTYITFFMTAYPMGIFHHMLLTHRSFKCKKWVEYVGSLLATLTWRGSMAGPVLYVALHRVHHAYSDTENDPHTPTKGIAYALGQWFWRLPYGFTKPKFYESYAPDMAKDKVHVWLTRHVHALQAMWACFCFALGAILFPWVSGQPWSALNGLRFAVYGVFVKTFLVMLAANLVDVINHTVGYRSYETEDQSTNSAWMALVHLGGAISWHNNHHAHQSYFSVRKKWWEIDMHRVLFLKPLQFLGLVWDIKVLDEVREKKSVKQGDEILSPA